MAQKLTKKNTKVQKVVKKVVVAQPTKSSGVAHTASNRVQVALPKGEYVEAVGRRKVASARVRLYKQPGDFIVNGMAAGQYFANILNSHDTYLKPFDVTETRNQFAVSVTVSGSGIASQLIAVRHGVARALLEISDTYRVALKQAGFLTRDDRMKETRKIGMGGKARRSRQSPKR